MAALLNIGGEKKRRAVFSKYNADDVYKAWQLWLDVVKRIWFFHLQ